MLESILGLAPMGMALLMGAALFSVRWKLFGKPDEPVAWALLAPPGMAVLTRVLSSDVALAVGLLALAVVSKGNTWVLLGAIIGLLCGLRMPVYALALTLVCGLVLALLVWANRNRPGEEPMMLTITVPEELRAPGVFDDVLKKYTLSYTVQGIRTVEMGMFFEMAYALKVSPDVDTKAFLDALRSLNGNLPVSLTVAAGQRRPAI